MAKKDTLIFSHWYTSIGGLQESAQKFYQSLEETIKRYQIPDVKISRIDFREGTIMSAKREYCRIKRKEHVFDVCAAPFGTSFFVSWWLGEKPPGFLGRLILSVPLVGQWLLSIVRPVTYYRLDTALMFQSSINQVVQDVIDEMTKAKGLRSLTEMERKPILSNLFNR